MLQLASSSARSEPPSALTSPRPDLQAAAQQQQQQQQQQAQPSSSAPSLTAAHGSGSGYLGYLFGSSAAEEQPPPGPEVCKLAGSWLAFLNIGQQRYWTLAESKPDVWVAPEDPLPSDCRCGGAPTGRRWGAGELACLAPRCGVAWERCRARSPCSSAAGRRLAAASPLAPPTHRRGHQHRRRRRRRRYREDLANLARGDVKASQHWKEVLENLQRADKKLRPQNAGGH